MDVYVSARKLSIPPVCPCCEEYPDAEMTVSFTRTSGKRVVRHQTRGWTFPYCRRCLHHVELWSAATGIGFSVRLIGLIAAIGMGIVTGEIVVALVVFVAALPCASVLANRKRNQAIAACAPSCGSAGTSIAYSGWDGSVQGFQFTSRSYAARFAGANARALINVGTDLRQRLASVATAPEAAALPSANQRPSKTDSPEAARDAVVEWIARIEGYKGTVARRSALARALEAISDPEDQRALVLATSKIEVAALLDKVDSLATPAAKRRHLEKAISDLRTDDVPDELQCDELDILQSALTALERP